MTYLQFWKANNVPHNIQMHMADTGIITWKIISQVSGKNIEELIYIFDTTMLHDTGKLAVCNFSVNTHLLGRDARNIEYWQQKQAELIGKHGNSELGATLGILNSWNISNKVTDLLQRKESLKLGDPIVNFDEMVLMFADLNVAPQPKGISGYKYRIEDYIKRTDKQELWGSYIKYARRLKKNIAKQLDGGNLPVLYEPNRFYLYWDLVNREVPFNESHSETLLQRPDRKERFMSYPGGREKMLY